MPPRVSALVFAAACVGLSGCAPVVGDLAAEVALDVLNEAIGGDSSPCEPNCTPALACATQNEADCSLRDEPDWDEVSTVLEPPAGTVGPPPDCTVCSPESRPSAPGTGQTLFSGLPQYLMSDECLIDHMRALR